MPRAEKPTLEAVMDALEIDYRTDRVAQKIHCPLPDHDDRSPSCNLNLEYQLWNCQACAVGGDAWTMIMKVRDVDFKGAVRYAAAERLATRDDGDGDEEVRGLSFGGGVRLPGRKGNRAGSSGGFTPRFGGGS